MRVFIVLIIVMGVFSGCNKVDLIDNDQQMDSFFYVDFEGAQMPVLVEGNIASGKFIVVVHGGPGGGGMSYIGYPAIEKLEEDYAVVYYSQRLSDNSLAISGSELTEPSRAQFAEDLNAIITTLKHKYGDGSKFYLLGHSWGGELITEFMSTSEYQSQVQGMINVSGGLRLSDTEKERATYMHELISQIAATEIAEGENLERWNEIYTFCQSVDTNNIEDYSGTLWSYGWDISWKYLREEGKITSQDIPGFETNEIAPQLGNGSGTKPGIGVPSGILISDNPSDFLTPDGVTERLDQTASLVNITKPSLIISGKYDCVVPPKLSEFLFNGISTPLADKNYVEMDSIAHDPFNRGEEFFQLVHDFVEQY